LAKKIIASTVLTVAEILTAYYQQVVFYGSVTL